jgi:hypothetical protein
MKYSELKLGNRIHMNNSSLKAEVIYVKHVNGITQFTLKLISGFRLICSFPSKDKVNV